MLKELTSTDVWRDTQDALAILTGHPILVTDTTGIVLHTSGKFPFVCEVVLKKAGHKCAASRATQVDEFTFVQCHAGLVNAIMPLRINKKKQGYLICTSLLPKLPSQQQTKNASLSIGLDKEELYEQLQHLSLTKQEHMNKIEIILRTAATLLPQLTSHLYEQQHHAKYYAFLLGLHNIIARSLHINTLLQSLVTFIAENMHLDDCSILLPDRIVRYKKQENTFIQFEKILYSNIQNTKTTLYISNPSHDFQYQALPNSKTLGQHILSIPLLQDNTLLAVIVLYNAQHLRTQETMTHATTIITRALQHALSLDQAKTSAITDSLTTLYNKGYFTEALKNEVIRARKYSRPTSLLLFDIDHFKTYNDTYGHPAGDDVLENVGKLVKNSVKEFDIACRYGGEEFALILPETKPQIAQDIAERLRERIAQHTFAHRTVTISIGVITCLNSSISPEQMIKEADKALYTSKKNGRNKTSSVIVVDKSLQPIDATPQNQQAKK
jgi:diguanylate cyclase (GGDEF)-like protein